MERRTSRGQRDPGEESNPRVFTVLMLALYASIGLIFIAGGDALLFLLAWEVMSILCYLLIVSLREGENGRAGSRYLLLAMGEAGTLSLAALPPFNGFVSEWLTLQTMLRSSELASPAVKMVFALSGAGLALTAALAVNCFVKVFAMSFLGMRRLDETRQVIEAKPGSLVPIFILAALCLVFGIPPTYVIPILGLAVNPLTDTSAADALVPPFFASNPAHKYFAVGIRERLPQSWRTGGEKLFTRAGPGDTSSRRRQKSGGLRHVHSLSVRCFDCITAFDLRYRPHAHLTRGRTLSRQVHWDGGVRRLLPEMTYTATGFSTLCELFLTRCSVRRRWRTRAKP